MMAAKNDITGDLIQSRKSNENFDKGFGQIDWSVKLEQPVAPTDKPVESTEEAENE